MSENINNMELEDNFFEQDEIANEKSFMEEFESPVPFNQVMDITTDEPKGGTEGKTTEDQEDDQGSVEAFKFDDTMAEEEKAELAELNAKLGTDFESMAKLKESLKTEDKKGEELQIEQERRYINYFRDLLDTKKYDDSALILEDKKITAINNNENLADEDVIERIKAEVALLEDSGMTSYAAKAIRDNLSMHLEKKEAVVNQYDSSKQLSAQQKEQKYKEDLQAGINEIFKQGKFFNIQPTKEDLLDIYKEVSKNKHIEHLKANPKDAVEFALFKRYRDVISKNLAKPDFNAGVKNTLKEFGMSSSEQTGKSANDISKGGNEEELSFLQKFAK